METSMAFFTHKQLHNPLHASSIVTRQRLDTLLGVEPPVNKQRERYGSPEGAVEARRLIAEAQKKYAQDQQQSQETEMQAETETESIKDLFKQWDIEDTPFVPEATITNQTPEKSAMTTQPQFFQVTNGVTQATFNYVRDNPNLTSAQIAKNLETLGFKTSSTSSLVYQMARQGLLHKDNDNRFTTIAREYSPLKAKLNRKLVKQLKPVHRVDIPRGTHGIAALTPSATPTVIPPTPSATPPALTAKYIMETLSIKEAHALYREMQSMFGG
jgi:hypothetical protein